jgi:hypothetical protein
MTADPPDEPSPFLWSDHAGKLALASPCLAAAVTLGIACVATDATVAVALAALNAVLAVAGSMAAGLLVRGTTAEKAGAAIGASVVGLFGYVVALLAVGLVGGMILRIIGRLNGAID